MNAVDRTYVEAAHRLYRCKRQGEPFLVLAKVARAVLAAERDVLASGADSDYLEHLRLVAEGGPNFEDMARRAA